MLETVHREMLALLRRYRLGFVAAFVDRETEDARQVEGTLDLIIKQGRAVTGVAFHPLGPVGRLYAKNHFGPFVAESVLLKVRFSFDGGSEAVIQ